ncbi:retrovirus-related Pol polyprotein from transposon 412 [Trichonephila clavipes]|nr:retrovirus-related Pol polyprotein from transposon 412 [Trichonephila clavipes]
MLFGRDLRLPCDLLFGRPPDTPSSPEEYVQNLQARFEDVHNLARERIDLRTEKMKTRYDTKATGHQFKEGDKVWFYNPTRRKGLSPKLQSHWDGPYTILDNKRRRNPDPIVGLREAGLSYRAVAARVQRNSSTIMRVSKQWTDEGRTARKSVSGPRNVTSAREDRRLVRMAQTDRTAFSRQLAAQWSTATRVSLCASSIRRRLL